jgi:hypothetical protein
MTIHLCYPCSNRIRTPDAIGAHLALHLRRHYPVVVHNWDAAYRIEPEPGDVLLGHAHPAPLSVFRRSMRHTAWRRVILMQPFNHSLAQLAWLQPMVERCDWFLAITGDYWITTLASSAFASWKPKMIRLDLAVDTRHFPLLKTSYAPPGRRSFLYVGGRGAGKNTGYLQALAQAYGAERFATAGARIPGLHCHGQLDFAQASAQALLRGHDCLLMTSDADANPTTLLEAMAWGLVPMATQRCGYLDEPGIAALPLANVAAGCAALRTLDWLPDAELKRRASFNRQRVQQHYHWERFGQRVLHTIERPDRGGAVRTPAATWLQLAAASAASPHSPLRPRQWRALPGAMLAWHQRARATAARSAL